MIHYIEHPSPVGLLLLAATEKGISGLYFEEHKHFNGKAGWRHNPMQPHLISAANQLDGYFAGRRTAFDLVLDTTGTPFQRMVWQTLATIPFGSTGSYTEHAQRIGCSSAIRAVGTAIGRNPISIIIPCHRIIGRSGNMTGYAGGLERKRYLLAFEGVHHGLRA